MTGLGITIEVARGRTPATGRDKYAVDLGCAGIRSRLRLLALNLSLCSSRSETGADLLRSLADEAAVLAALAELVGADLHTTATSEGQTS